MPVRVSEAQAKLIFGQKPQTRPAGPGKTPRPAAALRLAENDVEAQCRGFLTAKGWNVDRQQVGTYVPYYVAMKLGQGEPLNHRDVVRIGTKGQCDWRATRAKPGQPGRLEAFELEVKRAGCRPDPDQVEYMRRRNAMGYLCTWASSIDQLIAWYKAQGF